MSAREIKKLSDELDALRLACRFHDNLPVLNRRFGEQTISRDVAAAVQAAIESGHAAQAAGLVQGARRQVPSSGQELWNTALTAGEAQLVSMPSAAPRPPSTPWPVGTAGSGRASNPAIVLLAQAVLWGGSLLVAWLMIRIHYVADVPAFDFGGGLALGTEVGPRLAGIGLQLAPLLLAGVLVARSVDRWLTLAAAGVAAAAIQYVFFYASYSTAWVLYALVVVLVFAGWLAVRERSSAAYLLLVPVAVIAGLWFAPYRLGNWLRAVPYTHGWQSEFAFSAWPLVVFAAAGLVGVPAVAIRVSSRATSGPGRLAVAGLAAAAVVAGVLGQTAFSPAATPSVPIAYADPPTVNTQAGSNTSAGSGSEDPSLGQSAADTFFDGLESGGVTSCDGTTISEPVHDYVVSAVSPQTSGGFLVSANVSLSDGTYEEVTVQIDILESGSCAEQSTLTIREYSPEPGEGNEQPSAPASTVAEPGDVPSVPSNSEAVPTDAALPGAPADDIVVPYSDESQTPDTADQIVEYRPGGLSSAETSAVGDVISFMTRVNQQKFSEAWDESTYSLTSSRPNSTFRQGYRTSRFYQVAFGQPRQLANDLIVLPARFVSRQDPAAQGYPSGVTDCSYWPQYVFVVAHVDGRWLVDTAGRFTDRPELNSVKRDGGRYVNPIAQRESC